MTAMSMETRKELIEAVGFRYRSESRLGKTKYEQGVVIANATLQSSIVL
jgi:hypothetical protein